MSDYPTTAPELRALFSRIKLRQVEAGRILGVNDRTVRAWISGATPITPTAARLFHILEQFPDVLDLLRDNHPGQIRKNARKNAEEGIFSSVGV